MKKLWAKNRNSISFLNRWWKKNFKIYQEEFFDGYYKNVKKWRKLKIKIFQTLQIGGVECRPIFLKKNILLNSQKINKRILISSRKFSRFLTSGGSKIQKILVFLLRGRKFEKFWAFGLRARKSEKKKIIIFFSLFYSSSKIGYAENLLVQICFNLKV